MRGGAMGWKGPFVILFIGVVGLTGLGVMADMVLRNPQAKAVITARQALIERFGIHDVELSPRGQRAYVRIWVPSDLYRAEKSGALPAHFAALPEFYAASFEGADIPRSLHVEFCSTANEETLARHRIDLTRTEAFIRGQVNRLAGSESTITPEGTVLVVRGPSPKSSRVFPRIARAVAPYRSQKWSAIRVELGAEVRQYDGKGRAVDSKPKSRTPRR